MVYEGKCGQITVKCGQITSIMVNSRHSGDSLVDLIEGAVHIEDLEVDPNGH